MGSELSQQDFFSLMPVTRLWAPNCLNKIFFHWCQPLGYGRSTVSTWIFFIEASHSAIGSILSQHEFFSLMPVTRLWAPYCLNKIFFHWCQSLGYGLRTVSTRFFFTDASHSAMGAVLSQHEFFSLKPVTRLLAPYCLNMNFFRWCQSLGYGLRTVSNMNFFYWCQSLGCRRGIVSSMNFFIDASNFKNFKIVEKKRNPY